MLEFAKSVPKILVAGPETVLPGLQGRDLASCVTDPICLGSVGDEAQVDRILLTRVKSGPDGLQLDTDYFEVQDRLFIRYDSKKGLSGTSDLVEAVVPSMKIVLDIRDGSSKQTYVGKEDSSMVQSIVAYGAAGLAAACLGAGIYYGMDASSQVDDFEAAKRADGTYPFTQKKAQDMIAPRRTKPGNVQCATRKPDLPCLVPIHKHGPVGIEVFHIKKHPAACPVAGYRDFPLIPGAVDFPEIHPLPAWMKKNLVGILLHVIGNSGPGARDLKMSPVFLWDCI